MPRKQRAWWTYDKENDSYYFWPGGRTSSPPYKQIEITAIVDVALDGTLAGIELGSLFGTMPPPPKQKREQDV